MNVWKAVMRLRAVLKNANTTRLLIAEKGMSLRGFSKEIGISQGYLSQVLKGDKIPSPKIAFKIARGLGQDVNEFFFIYSD